MSEQISAQLIAFNQKLSDFSQAKALSDLKTNWEHKLSDNKKLQVDLANVNNVDRLLRVGIIGRVKAGKSSLLNALIFEGKDILPKAATPMTAALTRMEYSETVRAEVEFYDQADLNNILANSLKYENALAQYKQQKLTELNVENEQLARMQRKAEMLSTTEMDNIAASFAREELEKCPELAAAYDQQQRIKQAKINLTDLAQHSVIEAQTTADLMGKLHNYVGSNGKYMPFTKSVKLYLPEPGLQGLEIVDTPGVNDPVQSREARTNEFLSLCDVVLVVSPAGQFLSQEDMDLMTRVTTKDGVQEVYLVASQADNQLFGSEKGQESSPIPVLDLITQKLDGQAKSILSGNENPMMQKVMALYQKHSVICTSSVADTMLRSFDQKAQWDANTQHVWSNFQKHYPDFFNDTSTAKMALAELSNISRIQQILAEVQTRKQEIQEKRRSDLIGATMNQFNGYLNEVQEAIVARMDAIQSADINEERQRLKEFEAERDDSAAMIEDEYRRAARQFESLKLSLVAVLDKATRDFNKHNRIVEEEKEEKFRNWEWEDGEVKALFKKVLGMERKKRYYDDYRTIRYDAINASQVIQFIREVRDSIANQLAVKNDEFRQEWEDGIVHNIFSGMREIHNQYQHSVRLERRKINNIVQNVFTAMPRANFEILDTIPERLKRHGTLKDSEARTFAKEAEEYMFEQFKPAIRKDIEAFLADSISIIQQQPIADQILGALEKTINQLIHEIENKQESIARYQLMQKDVAKLKQEIPNA